MSTENKQCNYKKQQQQQQKGMFTVEKSKPSFAAGQFRVVAAYNHGTGTLQQPFH